MKLGFIGAGKMASALAGGVIRGGAWESSSIAVADAHRASAEVWGREWGVRVCADNRELVEVSEVVLLCVKPGDVVGALSGLDLRGRLVVSVVAGLTVSELQRIAGAGARVVRVMPNTPALVGKGAAAYSGGEGLEAADFECVEKLFCSVGEVVRVKEGLMDVVTGLSGSGPAYVYTVIEALADGGVLMGLPRELALRLAAQTVAGAAEMVLSTGEHPAVLRDRVASPGGTTIAGIEALEKGGIRAALMGAVRVASERSRNLAAGK
jgi:pyrroline-5-carboxylate reductase